MKENKIHKLSRKEKAQESVCYAVNSIIQLCINGGCKRLGLTTSSVNERYVKEIAQLCTKEASEKKIELEFENLRPIALFAEELEKAKACDAVILVERYAHTHYSDIEKLQDIAKRSSVKILGVVSYR